MLVDQILEGKGRDVATIVPEATVADAVTALAEHNVGALVVSPDGGTVAGIVSERDIVRRLAADGTGALDGTVGDLMERNVATCTGSDDSEHLMNVMTDGRFRHLPVLDDGRLAGIISIGDVVKVRIDELATETEQLVGYIRTGR